MTTNTAHANCIHPVTKAARAKCRKLNGGATPKGLTVKPASYKLTHVIEMCSCKSPHVDGITDICWFCDRPVDLSAA